MRSLLLVVGALRLLAPGAGGPCPNVTVEDLLADPAVEEAIQMAWADTAEGTDHEKEQGGYIYTCEVDKPTGSEWTTVTESWPDDQATDHSIPAPPLKDHPECALVGWFHTHPGPDNEPVKGKPGWVNPMSTPSEADLAVAANLGVPGLAVWGTGSKVDGVSGFGPAGPLSACPGDVKNLGGSSGDPHLLTFDGLSYDLQTVGEHVLVRSEDGSLEVQARQEPVAGSTSLSANTAIAARVDGAVVELSATEVVLDGRRRRLRSGEDVDVGAGGHLSGSPGDVTLRWADGSSLRLRFHSVVVALADARRGAVSGLLGDFDGDVTDDLQAGGASMYADRVLTREELYDLLAPAWRVTPETSLFTYPDGTAPSDYLDEDFPATFAMVDHLLPEARKAAEQECRERGVDDPTQLANCVLDVGTAGDDRWAEEAGAVAEVFDSIGPVASPELIEAAGRGDLAQVQAQLAAGAPLDGRDDQGRTALHWAVVAGDGEVVASLLAAGADVELTDASGRTALHNAAFWGFEDIARALVSAGASTDRTDDSDQTPADLARQQGHAALAEDLS
jgi:hypothetical protein